MGWMTTVGVEDGISVGSGEGVRVALGITGNVCVGRMTIVGKRVGVLTTGGAARTVGVEVGTTSRPKST